MSRLCLVRSFAGLLFAVVACGATSARAETTTLPVFADTTISAAAPDHNLGGHGQILAGTDGSGRLRRGLLSFDVAGELPAGAIVHSATLYLTATSANPAAGEFHLHRVLADWGQGTGSGSAGSPAAPGDATWNNRRHGTAAWGVAGGLSGVDYVASPSATTLVSAAGEYAFPGLASDVQQMLDGPGGNFGWMLVSGREGTPQTARQFIAGEFGGETIPRLEIEYSAIPEPAATTLLLAATVAAIPAICSRRRRCGR